MPWKLQLSLKRRVFLCLVLGTISTLTAFPCTCRTTSGSSHVVGVQPYNRPRPTRLWMATSSSDVKKFNQRNKKRDVKTVVARLAKAAKEAAEANSKVDEKPQPPTYLKPKPRRNLDDDNKDENLRSITDLSKIIDQELLRPRDGYRPPRETSSMRTLLEHNDKTAGGVTNSETGSAKKSEYRDVAMVFSKPLSKDQITIEYASRLVLLGQMMKYDHYRPSLICFCGSTKPKQDNLVAETSAGVLFFRHLCAANDISLEGSDLCIVDHDDARDTSWSSSSSLHGVVEEMRRHHLDHWLEQSQRYESAMDEYGMTREEPRKKIHVHFTLISTDYHLCNLNDIHVRSSRQSPLNTMLHELEQSIRGYRGLAQITWRFKYSPYPYLDSEDDLTTFLGKCYKLAQDLRPLLVNIRGVANQDEFFQRDNYRALVATRGMLVTLLEEMNEAYRHNKLRKTTSGLVPPTLKAKLQKTIVPGSADGSKGSGKSKFSGSISIDVALESALLSLGRCADLVRPAGRLTSQSVSQGQWRDAMHQLEQFLELMQRACDPDRPLPANQWGQLITIAGDSTHSSHAITDRTFSMEDLEKELVDDPIDLSGLFDGDIGMDDSME